jgi:hypothetical protein
LRFNSLGEAIATLHTEAVPMSLNRFDPDPAASLVVAVNEALAATPYALQAGDHPDRHRDPNQNADVEMEYLYRMLVGRGHARQVFAGRHHYLELDVTRVAIDGDSAVYGFVKPRPILPPA